MTHLRGGQSLDWLACRPAAVKQQKFRFSADKDGKSGKLHLKRAGPGWTLGKLAVLVKCGPPPVSLAGFNVNTGACRSQSELHQRPAKNGATEKKKVTKKKESDHFRVWWSLALSCNSAITGDITVGIFMGNSCLAE